MQYKAIVFDVGDTLVEYTPNYAQIYRDRVRLTGMNVDAWQADAIAKALHRAIGEQIQKEHNGAARMPDDAFDRMLDAAALHCFFFA